MLLSSWENMSPEYVSQFMTFKKGDRQWEYCSNDTISMAAKQAEGVAYLGQLLAKRNLALLADEVGMGKTFQAIGLIHLLQQLKSDAKTLIIAPNRNICSQWKGEFTSFFNHHCKALIEQEPSVSEVYGTLNELVEALYSTHNNVYLTTIHALSGLTKTDVDTDNKTALAGKYAAEIKNKALNALGGHGFDLLIIDEAHYLRTRNGGSQKVEAAKSFFGQDTVPLAKNTLLMTATPTHSSTLDVWNIMRYFKDEQSLNIPNTETPKDAATILDEYAIRRFRLMQGQGNKHYAKHDYRSESILPVSFDKNPNAELFFGLYQRQLVKEFQAKGANRKFLYGYLEGFESFSQLEPLQKESTESQELSQDVSKDSFSKAPDSELLFKLSQEYFDCFNEQPQHPKYEALVDSFVPQHLTHDELNDIKHLVFVRRIPSVRELTKRINSRYDAHFGQLISTALNLSKEQRLSWQATQWSRVWLNRWSTEYGNSGSIELDSEELSEIEEQESDEHQYKSHITELFVVKKKGSATIEETKNTICTNVALRFRKPERVFSLFLEPSRDYLSEDYTYYFENKAGDRIRAKYSTAAFASRYEKYCLGEAPTDETKHHGVTFPTIWKYLVAKLEGDLAVKYEKWSVEVKENFANYFKVGVLFSSPVMIELFCWFQDHDTTSRYHDKHDKAHSRYLDFIEYSSKRLNDSWLLWYFLAAIETFEDVCEKVARVKVDDYQYDWRIIKASTSPALFASGEIANRDTLQFGFNSPFYPNVLVATSVFQEGVNLHLQCNKVHHYGIASTPGDHEQRVGRLDRLFGKVNRELLRGQRTELNINFPYLKNSFDEDQLASFLEKKARAESMLDKCMMDDSDHHIGNDKVKEWKKYLKQPCTEKLEYQDPYPAKFNDDLV